MKETHEEKLFREKINNYLKPLENKINYLDEQVTKLTKERTTETESAIKRILKKTDLFTRIRVYLELECLNMISNPNKPVSREQYEIAHEIGTRLTKSIIHTIQQWEKDKAPLCPPEENK